MSHEVPSTIQRVEIPAAILANTQLPILMRQLFIALKRQCNDPTYQQLQKKCKQSRDKFIQQLLIVISKHAAQVNGNTHALVAECIEHFWSQAEEGFLSEFQDHESRLKKKVKEQLEPQKAALLQEAKQATQSESIPNPTASTREQAWQILVQS